MGSYATIHMGLMWKTKTIYLHYICIYIYVYIYIIYIYIIYIIYIFFYILFLLLLWIKWRSLACYSLLGIHFVYLFSKKQKEKSNKILTNTLVKIFYQSIAKTTNLYCPS